MSILRGKNILLGITAGIAAYKTASLVRLFVKSGANVKVIMTPAAKEFITPLTLSTLSKNPVISSFKEDAMFYKFDSAYKLATNSVTWKETERVEKALNYYNSLLFVFPETKYSGKLKLMYQDLQEIQNKKTTTKS